MSVLGLIPARGASKRLAGKNVKLLCGKPLLAWTILEAQKSKLITALIVSTEDRAIMEVAWKYGCDVLQRPRELATDEASSLDVVRHAVKSLPGYDYVCLLQPTSPLRSVEDIDRMIWWSQWNKHTVFSCDWSGTIMPDGGVYVWPSGAPLDTNDPLWQSSSSLEHVDIDTQVDFDRAEELMRAREPKQSWTARLAGIYRERVKNGG